MLNSRLNKVQIATKAGISVKQLQRYGINRFCALSDDARKIIVSDMKRSSALFTEIRRSKCLDR